MQRQKRYKIAAAILVFLLFVAMVVFRIGHHSGNRSEDNKITDVIVKVSTEDTYGSGVIWRFDEEQVIILTAAHVVAGADGDDGSGVTITFHDTGTAMAQKVEYAPGTDLVFVTIPIGNLKAWTQRSLRAVTQDKAAFDALSQEAPVLLAGDGKVLTGTVEETWIYVTDFSQHMLLVDGEIRPGMSGGGLFDEQENFLGILLGCSSDKETAVLPLSVILAAWEAR